MKQFTVNKLLHVPAGIALGCAISFPILADDTEVLTGNRLDPGRPNIAFIIDTSGSMASDVVVGEDYDPDKTYTGTCQLDRIYWAQEGTGTSKLPPCDTNVHVNRDAFKCQAALDAMAQVGRYRDRFAQFDNNISPAAWISLQRATLSEQTNGAIRPTECFADSGVHGDIAGELYAADGDNGPWSSDPAAEIDWPNSGNSYTVYDGNYLNWIQETGQETTVSSRIKVVQSVVNDVLSDLSGVNVALMRFSTNAQGGMVIKEMVPVEQNFNSLMTAVNSLAALGPTPITETIFEARQYLTGGQVVFGASSESAPGTAQPSVAASQNANGNYIRAITRQCQRNYVVLLTDGLPTNDSDADDRIKGLAGVADDCDGSCLDELTRHMDGQDQIADSILRENQTIQTYTIGFNTDQDLLLRAATGRIPELDVNGDPLLDADGEPITRPGYFVANDPEQLAQAFNDILDEIQSDGEIFTAPSLTVDVQNRLTNREDLYFAMFQPPSQGQPHWDGNLKKYRIGRATGASPDSTPRVVDVNGRAALDDNGSFAEGAQSFWSLQPDEDVVTAGGFAETLTVNRNVYSNISGQDLTADINEVHESNTDLTAAMLAVDADEREAILRFARGLDAEGNARQIIGDPLHSPPTLVAYQGSTVGSNEFALFFGTNDGYLHAIDPEPVGRGTTDIEHFAFIPRDLLPQLKRIKVNAAQAQLNPPKAYGLDGPITAWIDETVKNNVVNPDDDAYLYVGMRRGGRNYYALDVTDVDNPELVWTITGGTGDFEELGQTWSAMTPAVVRWNDVNRKVLFFAGGNDTNQDTRDKSSLDDDMGRAIYMVDALTGQRLWWASIREAADLTLQDMTNSIPSNLRVLDTNQDGLADRIYVGDTKAQVWRFDIDNINGTISGDVFASLQGGGESGNRKIYSAPSVTRIITEDGTSFLTVAVGTGHRAHPLETDVRDVFYMLRDRNVFSPPVNSDQQITYPDPIERSDLKNVSNNISPSTDDVSNGWFIELDSGGEKSLSAPLTILDRIFFTTYTPTPSDLGCQPIPVSGTGRLYAVDILTGSPLHADAELPSDRYELLDSMGIPPAPTLVFTKPPCDDCDADDPVSEITLLVGTEALDPVISNIPRKTYWVQEDIDR